MILLLNACKQWKGLFNILFPFPKSYNWECDDFGNMYVYEKNKLIASGSFRRNVACWLAWKDKIRKAMQMKSIRQLAFKYPDSKILVALEKWQSYSSQDWSRYKPFKKLNLQFTYRKWCGQLLPSFTISWTTEGSPSTFIWIDLGAIFYSGWGFDIHIRNWFLFKWCPFGMLEHWLDGNVILKIGKYYLIEPTKKTYASTDTYRVTHIIPCEDGCNRVYYDENTCFYKDWKKVGIKPGDVVKIEKAEDGCKKRVWVNEKLISEDDYHEYQNSWAKNNR